MCYQFSLGTSDKFMQWFAAELLGGSAFFLDVDIVCSIIEGTKSI